MRRKEQSLHCTKCLTYPCMRRLHNGNHLCEDGPLDPPRPHQHWGRIKSMNTGYSWAMSTSCGIWGFECETSGFLHANQAARRIFFVFLFSHCFRKYGSMVNGGILLTCCLSIPSLSQVFLVNYINQWHSYVYNLNNCFHSFKCIHNLSYLALNGFFFFMPAIFNQADLEPSWCECVIGAQSLASLQITLVIIVTRNSDGFEIVYE